MFSYRIAYGCWLNDSRLKPITDEDWPSVRIDLDTLDSLETTVEFLKSAGYNCLDVFGLITNHSWNPDIAITITREREQSVKKVIEIIHRHGIKLIYGLGVYSWGFERIIEANIMVRGTSRQVMCASSLESEAIMRQVIDYLMNTFEIDGFHLEAADQGRCNCERCATITNDIDYYNRINYETVSYIRKNWSNKLILVNTSGYLAWGDTFNQRQLDQIVALGNITDIFIDVGSHGPFISDSDRKYVIRHMKASFGTANGFWVYPPQRWDRQRWFIPHCMTNYKHLKELYQDGGRSCELYLSPISNPGAEMTQFFNGLFLQNPMRNAKEIMHEAVEFLYKPSNPKKRGEIVNLFLRAEELFFSCWQPVRNRHLPEELSDGAENVFSWSNEHSERAIPGEIFLEPLWGSKPGFPCYLSMHFDLSGRRKYKAGVEILLNQVIEILESEENQKLGDVANCLKNILKDIQTAQAALGE